MRTVFSLSAIMLPAACISVAPGMDVVEEMMATDRMFAAMAVEEGVPAAFGAYAAEDVQMFPDGGQPYGGRDSMVERFATWPEGASLIWEPVEGMAATSEDFGFTWGRYVFTVIAEDGGETTEHGKYVTVWRKEADGWKYVADIGNSNPAPE